MEETIKVLEEFLKGNKYCEDCKEKCVDCYIEYEEVQAVAKLLQAYKEDERVIEELAKQVISDETYLYGEGYTAEFMEATTEYVINSFRNKVREEK